MPMRHASSREVETDSLLPAERVRVMLPLPLKGAYDYRAPPDTSLAPGTFVTVPLSGRERRGVVWDEAPAGETGVDAAKLKDVIAPLDAPPLPEVSRRFVEWVAGYTLSAPGSVLRMCMSVPEALDPPKPRMAFALSGTEPEAAGLRLTAARQRVLAVLADSPPLPGPDLAREAAVSPSVVKGLAEAGLLARVAIAPRAAAGAGPDPNRAGPKLSPDQDSAAAELVARARGGFSVTLLDGVTGSGKTEVDFEAVAEALRQDGQVLVLLPEIALSAQWLERFRARFGAAPVVWHSDLTRVQRRRAWRAVADGRALVVVGARSALFLPFRDLRLIVVDEEHDTSYKQEEGVIYHARDMAVVRARLGGISAVLASATPSLETMTNVERGRYGRLHLPERHGGAQLPAVTVVDMRLTPPPGGRWLSPPLEAALAETLGAGEQAMLVLNRRGYAPLTLCRHCGARLNCPNCTAWLVEHRLAGRVACHHCGHNLPIPESCPECGEADALVACGPGVERVAEEAAALFPAARAEIMTSDTVYGPGAAAELVRRVEAHEIDLLIGTQIMAKGHHFPLLTLVGVIDADLGLVGGDLRAAERTYQLLSQVAGRAGRDARPGRVVIQTYMPEHPVIDALVSGDRERFLAEEAAARRAARMPPFGRLAAVIVSGRDADEVDAVAGALGRSAPREDDLVVLGPAPAPLATLRGHHRRRLLVKAGAGPDSNTNLQGVIRRWIAGVRQPGGVRVKVDIDPYSFL